MKTNHKILTALTAGLVVFIVLASFAACQPRPAAEPQPVALATQEAPLWSMEFDQSGLGILYPCPIWWSLTGSTSGLGGNEPCGRTDQGVGAQAWFVPAAVTAPGDGYLHLRASKRTAAISYGGLTFPYNSGYATTGGYAYGSSVPKKWFTYGYFEARLKCPVMLGGWCAFWMWADPNSSAEIDITETLANQPYIHNMNLHGAATFSRTYRMATANTEWHTYAVDWQPGYVKWYLDDALVATYTGTGFNSKSLYVILSYQLGGSWAGNVDESKLPTDMLVDYVRVWTVKPGTTPATATPAAATNTPLPPTATRTRTATNVPATVTAAPVSTRTPECHWFSVINNQVCIP